MPMTSSPTLGMYYKTRKKEKTHKVSSWCHKYSGSFLRFRGAEQQRTRPDELSMRSAFFWWSAMSCPATVGMMSSGGDWRSPGPRRRGFLGCEGMFSGSIWSPGRTNAVREAIAPAQMVLCVVGWEACFSVLSGCSPDASLRSGKPVENLGRPTGLERGAGLEMR